MSLSALLEHVPALIKFGCVGLLVFTLIFLWAMIRSGSVIRRQLGRFAGLFASFGISHQATSRSGLDLETLDKLRTTFSNRQDLTGEWWQRLDDCIEMYIAPDETEQYFLTEPVREVMPYDAIIGEKYYGSFFGVIPGVLTGAGLTHSGP